MNKYKHTLYPIICWFFVVIWFFFFSLGIFNRARFSSYDSFNRLSILNKDRMNQDNRVVIVAVDETTIASSGLKWPWRRSVFANLLDNINKGNPKAVGFDFIFAGKSTSEVDDQNLAQSLARSVPVVLAYEYRSKGKDLRPYSLFTHSADSIGFVNKPSSAGGVVRHFRMFIEKDEKIDYSIETKLAALYWGYKTSDIYYEGGMLRVGDKNIAELDEDGVKLLNMKSSFDDYMTISASKVLNGNIPTDFFKDKIVLLGATASVMHDEFMTPLDVQPGVVVLANALSMILDKQYLYVSPIILDFFLILVLGLSILWFNRKFNFISGIALSFFVCVVWFFVMLALRIHYVQFDYFYHIFLAISAFVVSNVYKYCYLIYISNKIKNRAVTDSVTGFYNVRYFTLLVNQKIKSRDKNVSLIGLGVQEYPALARKYSYDEMKDFMSAFSRYLEVCFKGKIKKATFARARNGKFYVLVSGTKRWDVKEALEGIIHGAWESGFHFGDSVEMLHLSCVLVYSMSYNTLTGRHLMHRTEKLLTDSLDKKENNVVEQNLDTRIWGADADNDLDDEYEFLSIDIEERNQELETAIKEAEDIRKDVDKAYFDVVLSLVKALEEKDSFTQGHSDRTAKYSVSIAREAGWTEEECQSLYKAALLHDIGKIGIPVTVLHKKERLTDDEFVLIKKHPIMSVEILKPIKAFEDILPMILHHHEKYDGTGYPHGLNGDVIPVGAQILAVADCFDAITCGRGYKKGNNIKDGMEELERCSGTQFNPEYVKIFRKVLNL